MKLDPTCLVQCPDLLSPVNRVARPPSVMTFLCCLLAAAGYLWLHLGLGDIAHPAEVSGISNPKHVQRRLPITRSRRPFFQITTYALSHASQLHREALHILALRVTKTTLSLRRLSRGRSLANTEVAPRLLEPTNFRNVSRETHRHDHRAYYYPECFGQAAIYLG